MRPANRRFTTTSTVSPHCYRPEDLLPYHAVILASGKGSHLGALTTHKPKCLLPLGSETIIERQLRLLADCGIETAGVVAGYRSEQVAARLGNRVRLFLNPAYASSGPISSLSAARDVLDGDTIVLNADLVFSTRMLEILLTQTDTYSVAVNRERLEEGSVGVGLAGSRLVDIGKHITGRRSSATFLCAARVTAGGINRFLAALERCLEERVDTGWSRVFAELADSGQLVHACDYSGPWFDVNTVATYVRAARYSASAATVPTTAQSPLELGSNPPTNRRTGPDHCPHQCAGREERQPREPNVER